MTLRVIVEAMNDLKAKIALYREAVEFLKKDPNQVAYNVRAGWQTRYNQYQQRLPELFAAVTEGIQEVAFGLLPVGPTEATDKWAEIADEEVSNSVRVDSLKLYKELAGERLWASMGSQRRVFDSTQFAIVDDELRAIMARYHYDDVKYADYSVTPFLTKREDMVPRIKSILESQFGFEYRTVVLKGSITDAVLANPDLGLKTVVVIVTGTDANDATGLAPTVFKPGRFTTTGLTEEFTKLSEKEIRQRVLADVKEAQARLKAQKGNSNQ